MTTRKKAKGLMALMKSGEVCIYGTDPDSFVSITAQAVMITTVHGRVVVDGTGIHVLK